MAGIHFNFCSLGHKHKQSFVHFSDVLGTTVMLSVAIETIRDGYMSVSRRLKRCTDYAEKVCT